MESLLERGEKLDDLVSKSEVLGTQSKAFYKTVSCRVLWGPVFPQDCYHKTVICGEIPGALSWWGSLGHHPLSLVLSPRSRRYHCISMLLFIPR